MPNSLSRQDTNIAANRGRVWVQISAYTAVAPQNSMQAPKTHTHLHPCIPMHACSHSGRWSGTGYSTALQAVVRRRIPSCMEGLQTQYSCTHLSLRDLWVATGGGRDAQPAEQAQTQFSQQGFHGRSACTAPLSPTPSSTVE